MASSELLKRFYFLQEERVQTYQLFDEYLAGGPNYNFPIYKQLVHEITSTFKRISDEVITIEQKLQEDHRSVATIITKIQEAEKLKLEHTAKLQIATQNQQDHPSEGRHEAECNALKEKLADLKSNIYELMEELKYESEDIIQEGS